MKKNKQIVMSEKKYNKERKRKLIVKDKKIKKEKLSKEHIDQFLANIDKMEGKRREAVQDFLIKKGFELKEDKGEMVFEYQKENYKLSKLNLDHQMKEALGEKFGKFTGLFQIADMEEYKKVLVFQVQSIKDSDKFRIITVMSTLEPNKEEPINLKEFGISNPEGKVIFSAVCETKKECINQYTGGNAIQWKGLPSAGWKCLQIKK